MTTAYFTPVKLPDQGAPVKYKPNVLSTVMGDGYVQRTGNGINTMLRKMTLSWTNLKSSEALSIVNFFQQQAGIYAFYWTPIGETVQRCFICSEWQFKELSGGYCTIDNVIFEESAPT